MKQLQWEKVNKSNLEKTVWGQAQQMPQEEWAMKLKRVDVWSEMEDEFKAREVVYDAVGEFIAAACHFRRSGANVIASRSQTQEGGTEECARAFCQKTRR